MSTLNVKVLIGPPLSFPMTTIFTFRKKRFHKANMLNDEVRRDLLGEDYGDAIKVEGVSRRQGSVFDADGKMTEDWKWKSTMRVI